MGFSNDPFTPAQTRIDAEGVIAMEQANGDVLISARRNRLIFEERLPIPVTRRQLIQKEEEVENRWVFGIDNRDRDGFFVGRNLKPIEHRDLTDSGAPVHGASQLATPVPWHQRKSADGRCRTARHD